MGERTKILIFYLLFLALFTGLALAQGQVMVNGGGGGGEEIGMDELDYLLSPHRGGMSLAPENTIMAFENTRQIGLSSAEFDVRMTGDGEVVVHHDSDLERRTRGEMTGDVDDYTLNEITGAPAVSEYLEPYSSDEADRSGSYQEAVPAVRARDAEVPSLAETLDYFDRHNMVPRIDLKPGIRDDAESARQVYEMVSERQMTSDAIFIAFPSDCSRDGAFGDYSIYNSRICEWEGLEVIEDESFGRATTAALVDMDESSQGPSEMKYVYEEADKAGIDIIVPRWYNFDSHSEREEFVKEARSRGFRIAFMSVNSDDKMKELEFNPEWTSTNNPVWLKEKVEQAESITIESEEVDVDHSILAPDKISRNHTEYSRPIAVRYSSESSRVRDVDFSLYRLSEDGENWHTFDQFPEEQDCWQERNKHACRTAFDVDVTDFEPGETEIEVRGEGTRFYDGSYYNKVGGTDFEVVTDSVTVELEDGLQEKKQGGEDEDEQDESSKEEDSDGFLGRATERIGDIVDRAQQAVTSAAPAANRSDSGGSEDEVSWREYCAEENYDTSLSSERVECIEDDIKPECFVEGRSEQCVDITEDLCDYLDGRYSTQHQRCITGQGMS